MWEICANQLLPKALKSGPKSKKITQSGHTAKVEYPGDQSYSRGALCVVVLIDFIITQNIQRNSVKRVPLQNPSNFKYTNSH